MEFQRVIPLEGGCNLRDLGGYITQDGRKVRTGKLYRSGVMSYFSANDQVQLAELNIHTICDLRTNKEREEEPTIWPHKVETLYWEDTPSVAQMQGSWLNEGFDSAEAGHQSLVKANRLMVESLKPQLSAIYLRVAESHVPLVFHCSAGKDRTGITAAVLLHMLGVSREHIIQDYLFTNQAVDLDGFMRKHSHAKMGVTDEEHPWSKLHEGARQALLKADEAYLSAAFEEIERQYSSVDNYVRDELGIDDNKKQRICELLLEG